MNTNALINQDIHAFILDHEKDDPAKLALKKSPCENWPYPLVLEQIKARQSAKTKWPSWYDVEKQLLFPPTDLLEQASSEATAKYKASLVSGKTFIDLTAGSGIDSWAIVQNFDEGICIEHNAESAARIAHNLPLLTDKPLEVINIEAQNYIDQIDHADLIYIDPQRRNQHGKGLYRLGDQSPNILDLLPKLKTKTETLMLKAAPMLDIHQAVKDLEYVHAVHIVEHNGDCKEVLYILRFDKMIEPRDIPHIAVQIDEFGQPVKKLEFTLAEEQNNPAFIAMPERYLYEPGPTFQKAGGFNTLAQRYELKKLHKHTHLYTSQELSKNFPGRIFEIINILPVQKKALKLKKANLSIRNFPGSVTDLQKKLKLKDGGKDYLFACTLANEKKVLIQGIKTKY